MATVLSVALALVIGTLDYFTGREVLVSPFYLVPICWLTWKAGGRAGLLLAVACALIWLAAELMAHYTYRHPAIPYWNAVMLLVINAVVVLLLSAAHDAQQSLREANATLERRVVERTASLREQGRKLAAIVETAAEGIVTVDSRGIVESMNRAAEQMFGYRNDEILGRNVSLLLPAPYREELDSYIARHIEPGHAKVIGLRQEVSGQRKDGTVFPMDYAVSEFAIGGERRFVAVVRDITKRKRLEAAIDSATEAERGRIARDLHDGLGQQLGGALFLSDLLQRDLKERGAVESARAEKVHAVIVDALRHAREVSRGLYPVSPEPDGLMNALQNLADRVARDYQIECVFECVFDMDSAVLLSDETLVTNLYRIAQEAVSNALKHSGARRIEIKLANTGHKLELSVRDYGSGLPRTPPPQGLGMQTMSRRADLIGGRLLVHNHESGGVRVLCSVTRTWTVPQAGAPEARGKETD